MPNFAELDAIAQNAVNEITNALSGRNIYIDKDKAQFISDTHMIVLNAVNDAAVFGTKLASGDETP